MRPDDTIRTILIPFTTLMLLCGLLCGCGAATGSGRTGAGTPTSTAAPPTPTAGPPTPTPTALEQQLDALVQPAIGNLAYDTSVRFDQASSTATVTATVKQCSDIPTTQELVKTVAFRALKALWTSSEAFKDVSMGVLGPFQDDFGNHTLQAYGSADVTAQTAAKLNWASLSPDTAWSAYTNVFLAPSYAAGQYWNLPTPTPPGPPGDIQACAAA
jgi:hypothetical protein